MHEDAAQGQVDILACVAVESLVCQRVAAGLLERLGYSVTLTTPDELAEHADFSDARLALVDVDAWNSDGAEILKQLAARRGDDSEPKLLALVDQWSDERNAQWLSSGADACLLQPVRYSDLPRALEDLAGQQPASIGDDEQLATSDSSELQAEYGEKVDWQVAMKTVHQDESLLEEIVQMFLQEAPAQVKDIQSAIREQDAPRLQRAAHTLKSSLRCFGLEQTTELALKLEHQGRDGNFAGANELSDEIARRVEQACEQVNNRA